MTQFSTTNAGIVAGPSHSDNLALKVFSGEVLKTYNTNTVMKGRHREKTISSGKSAQFPAIGKASAEYHTPGHVILGQDMDHGEKVISIDDMLVASTFMSNYEEAMNHYNTRSEYTVQIGEALGQSYDQHLFAIATKAAVNGDSGAVAGMAAATEDNIGTTPTVTDFVDAIYAGAEHFDATNIPQSERVIFVTPSMYWSLVKDGSFIDRDFNNSNGSKADGTIMRVAGIEIVKTNNLALDFGTATLAGKRAGSTIADYTVDGTASLGLLMQKQALGTVKLMDLSTESDYQVNRQGTLVVSKMACGHGVLRPECLRLISAKA